MNRPLRLTLLPLALLASAPAYAQAGPLHRDRDPVVLAGAQVPALLGAAPGRIVAFRWDRKWVPIPVQVDERARVDFSTIYGVPIASGLRVLTYTDPALHTGADPDPEFDRDDELVFMAREAGPRSPASPPPRGARGAGIELTVHDPIRGGVGYVYLFRSDGTLDPAPGADAVRNHFRLLPAGADYRTDYATLLGPNPENTTISSPLYSVHFSDRWVCDEMRVTGRGGNGVDLLDRRRVQFAPGDCDRTEQSFSRGEGALIVNRQGPVRVLRGYCGANSGPTTYRIHAFYEGREDVFTALRVHAIPGVVDVLDYSPAAAGMTYHTDLRPEGVPVDGAPDSMPRALPRWEMLTGAPGTVVSVSRIRTNVPSLAPVAYYRDQTPARDPRPCAGDGSEFAASGIWIADAIPNTDPVLGDPYLLESTRVIVYDGPHRDAAFAAACAEEALTPLAVTAAAYRAGAARSPRSGARLGARPQDQPGSSSPGGGRLRRSSAASQAFMRRAISASKPSFEGS